MWAEPQVSKRANAKWCHAGKTAIYLTDVGIRMKYTSYFFYGMKSLTKAILSKQFLVMYLKMALKCGIG